MTVIATLAVKLQAQIAEFQSEFKQAAQDTKKFEENFQSTATKSVAYGTLIARGLEIGIGAAQRLGEAALENASRIDDLSKKTGLSMRTIQEFQFVAGETGATVDQFANAAFKLGTNLAGGSKSVVAGVKELGLSFDDLRAKSPDDQFRTVIKALEDMDDQQEANRLGVLLFGRTYKDIAVAVAEGYSDLAAGARVMADEQVKRLADAEDAWKRFGRTTVIVSGEILAETIRVVDEATNSWSDFFKFILSGPGNVFRFPPPDPNKGLTPEQIAFDASFNDIFRRQTAERTQAAKDATAAAEDAAERQKKAFEKSQRAAEAYRNEIIKLRDEFSGAKLGADVKKIEEAFRLLTDKQKDNIDVQKRVGDAAEDLRQKGALLSPELLTLAVRTEKFSDWLNKVPGQTARWADSFDTLRTALEPALVLLDDVEVALAQIALQRGDAFVAMRDAIGGTLEPLADVEVALKQIKDAQRGLGDVFKEMAPGLINTLGNALRSGASEQKWEQVGADIGGSIGQGIGAYFGGPAGAAIGGQIGGAIGGWIGGMFDATEYETRAKEAAAALRTIMVEELGAIPTLLAGKRRTDLTQIGGFAFDPTEFERLRQQFALVGIQIDEALRTRDPKWLREVLDDGYAKTQLLAEAMKEYGFTWENLGAEGRALQLGDLLSELKAKTDVLIGAGIDELDVLIKQEAQYESLLLKAIATNTEIPESMRPLLERMQELGLLTDDVTGEFIDLGQVQWAKTLTQGFSDVVSAIDRLTGALTGGLVDGFDRVERSAGLAARRIEREFSDLRISPVRVPIEYDDPGFLGGLSVPTLASGGIVTRPTLALFGEAGPEAVIPLNQLANVAPSGGGGTAIIELEGREIARVIVPLLPGEVRRYVPA